MYFLIKDDGLLEKYNTIWDKVNVLSLDFALHNDRNYYQQVLLKVCKY